MVREDNGRLRRSVQRQEYDGSGPPPGEDAGYGSDGYPERVGGEEMFFGGARRTTGEPERVGHCDEHGNRGVELDSRSSGTGRWCVAQQQDGCYPPEEAEYVIRDYHHHDPEGLETRSLPRHYDVDGRVEGKFTNRDGNCEKGDLQPNGYADGSTGIHDFGQRGPDGRSGEESGGRESYRCSPRVRYRQHHRHGDDHHESARHVRDGTGVGFMGRDPRNSSSSGSSDRGSIGRQNFTQVDAVEGSTVADPGRSRAKRVQFSQGIQGPAHEPSVPRSSVRRHLVSPKALPSQRAAASPKVQKCAQDSPAKRWRSQADRSLSPVSTGTRPFAADSEDKTTVSPEKDDSTRPELAARIAGLGARDSAVLDTWSVVLVKHWTHYMCMSLTFSPHDSCLRQISETKPASLNEALVKTPKDMLLFSKKARQVDYKPCTLKEYRETKPTGYVELGKLQPDLYTDELVAKGTLHTRSWSRRIGVKLFAVLSCQRISSTRPPHSLIRTFRVHTHRPSQRANAERIKEFSTNLRKINSDTAAARGDGDRRPRPKKKDQDSRTRALAFARKIPLPRKVVKAQQPPAADLGDPGERRRANRRGGSGVPETEGWRSAEMTELEALEAMHDDMRKKLQEARSSF
ncbi:unnamed protein product [Ectocarpus sp. CCAP 1310/34]|nr:unnamed protein product [Ectocarpus sp. CCAP 1310/34]